MKNKIFIYLFSFSVLFNIFQYMNQKNIFEIQQKKLNSLTAKSEKLVDSVETLNNKISDLNYFTFIGNEKAMTYMENIGYEAHSIEAYVMNEIYDKNLIKGGNPIVPFEGMNGPMLVNKIQFLNHKWLQADFSDGKYWGEVLIEYSMNENGQLELRELASLLYPLD